MYFLSEPLPEMSTFSLDTFGGTATVSWQCWLSGFSARMTINRSRVGSQPLCVDYGPMQVISNARLCHQAV